MGVNDFVLIVILVLEILLSVGMLVLLVLIDLNECVRTLMEITEAELKKLGKYLFCTTETDNLVYISIGL